MRGTVETQILRPKGDLKFHLNANNFFYILVDMVMTKGGNIRKLLCLGYNNHNLWSTLWAVWGPNLAFDL